MSDRSDALRYARELFEVTWRHQQADAVASELEAIGQAIGDRSGVARPLLHPLVSQSRKLETVRALVSSLGLSRPTAVLLDALVEGYRLSLLPAIAKSFRDRLNHKHGV